MNTVESLANYDKSNVEDLNHWFNSKIDKKKADGIFLLYLINNRV